MNNARFYRLAAVAITAVSLMSSVRADFSGALAHFSESRPADLHSIPVGGGAFGNWQLSIAGSGFTMLSSVDTRFDQLSLKSEAVVDYELIFSFILSEPTGAGVVTFDYDFRALDTAEVGDGTAAYTTNGGVSWNTISNYGLTSNFVVNLAAMDRLGFRVSDLDRTDGGHSLTISNISFTPIPEPGATGAFAALAALGYTSFATRRRRSRV